jgi:PPP family 3-phenylpropionic acid transporter
MVKGQAFITASYTLGCAMGNLTGGVLMESFGVIAILVAGVVIAALGTVVLLLTVDRQDTYRLTHP